jgi:hypothetical protein
MRSRKARYFEERLWMLKDKMEILQFVFSRLVREVESIKLVLN